MSKYKLEPPKNFRPIDPPSCANCIHFSYGKKKCERGEDINIYQPESVYCDLWNPNSENYKSGYDLT